MNSEARQLEEALSWRFVNELYRRYPREFALIEAHAGGGQYDSLVLLRQRAGFEFGIDVNRGGGSVHLHTNAFVKNAETLLWGDWMKQLLAPQPSRFLDAVCNAARLEIPDRLPSTTPATLVFRFITEFLTHAVGRPERWECRNGFEDTSGYGGGVRSGWFDLFPPAKQRATVALTDDPLSEPAYRFWFLLEDKQPRLCLETSGTAYALDGQSYDLMPLYKKHRRIWPVISHVALALLP